MRSTTVRITKCDKPLAWYSDKIGQEFEVYQALHDSYLLKADYDQGTHPWRCIARENAVEVCAESSETERDAHKGVA